MKPYRFVSKFVFWNGLVYVSLERLCMTPFLFFQSYERLLEKINWNLPFCKNPCLWWIKSFINLKMWIYKYTKYNSSNTGNRNLYNQVKLTTRKYYDQVQSAKEAKQIYAGKHSKCKILEFSACAHPSFN